MTATLPLTAEHKEDLHASGLSDLTIATLLYESVCPADIPVRAAGSAYRLPYFNLDGSINCFARLKLFPAVSDGRGHTQKYWQPSGSTPGLYAPPLLNWAAVAKDPSTTLVITEGEKKAAAGCQAGLTTAGVGGVWNWTSTLDSGARLVLPLLDDFQWPARPVLICPDSDAWREGKEQHILSGFFALAKDLQSRGAFVQFVMLPDLHGAKTGLDDWLKEPGNTVEHAWPQLPRLALDHARFRALTAWWQGWKEKQATQEALKSRHADEPVVDATGGVYTVTFPTYHTRFILTRLHESSRAVTAELAVLIETVEVSSGVTLSLTSDSSREQICKSLKAIESRLPWKVLIQKACAAVLKRHRTGEPLITLSTARPVEHVSFLVNPFLYQRKITVIFGDGGLGKSTFLSSRS